ncbi:MAG: type 4a pilus biogenesis protein PilO [Myxococcota bacterium]|nr:type 4a pilus biogenesis protein PilO [Myxococcota bacterium]
MAVFGVETGPAVGRVMALPGFVRFAGIAVVLLGIAGGYYGFWYSDARAEVDAMNERGRELQRQLANVRVVTKNLVEFQREVEALESEFQSALSQLPNRKQFEDLLQDITTAGKKVGVQIKSIERLSEVQKDFYAEVPFQLELEGSYHGMAMFFERLARLPRIVNMGTLQIETVDESGDGATLRVRGEATTYRFLAG